MSDTEKSPSPPAFKRPQVAGREREHGLVFAGGAAVFLGAITFMWLSGERAGGATESATSLPGLDETGAISAPAFPPELAALEKTATTAVSASPQLVIPVAQPMPLPAPALPDFAAASEARSLEERRRAPSVVVDLGREGVTASLSGEPAAATPSALPASAGEARSSADETFAARVGAAGPESAQATLLRNTGAIVPQGALIPGVLETALSSDLPGFARAIVSRDVRSFDGTTVLVPRGSRVVGQYSSGVAIGQARIFVIWTRVITPQGVSIQIGSPGADALGRGGLEGDVDRHFFQRFGGALLLSVVSAAGAAIVDQPTTQVIIGSTQGAGGGVAAPMARADDIPPTIKVPQGTPIRIFVARDLDFSAAQALIAKAP